MSTPQGVCGSVWALGAVGALTLAGGLAAARGSRGFALPSAAKGEHAERDAHFVGEVLAALRAIHWNAWDSHWQAKGANSYGDHLLFERIYTQTVPHIDGLAEKMVGSWGDASVDAIAPSTQKLLAEWAKTSDRVKRATEAEHELHRRIFAARKVLEQDNALTMGLDDFLMGVANDHETFIYLLQQRAKGGSASRRTSRRRTGNDNPAYQWYVLAVPTGHVRPRIESGWESKEDAKGRLAEARTETLWTKLALLARRSVVSAGLDPRDDAHWLTAADVATRVA